MPVITVDNVVEGLKRKDVFAWLSVTDNHDRFLSGAFNDVSRASDTEWTCTLKLFPKSRVMRYRFIAADDEHGGRRILCETDGKRTKGKLHYSLRTPRGSRDTLITLHMDYDPGSMFGLVVDVGGLRDGLEKGLVTILSNLKKEIYQDVESGKLEA
jgi:hypothetical protein